MTAKKIGKNIRNVLKSPKCSHFIENCVSGREFDVYSVGRNYRGDVSFSTENGGHQSINQLLCNEHFYVIVS